MRSITTKRFKHSERLKTIEKGNIYKSSVEGAVDKNPKANQIDTVIYIHKSGHSFTLQSSPYWIAIGLLGLLITYWTYCRLDVAELRLGHWQQHGLSIDGYVLGLASFVDNLFAIA